jgi:hypothetical protein
VRQRIGGEGGDGDIEPADPPVQMQERQMVIGGERAIGDQRGDDGQQPVAA